MRTVVLFITCSLDGYIARPSGAVDWLFTDQDYGYTPFLAGIDTVLMGRKTYEQSLDFGETYAGFQVYVGSRSRAGEREGHVHFVGGDWVNLVNELKSQPGKNLWLVGGSEIIAQFLEKDLIDEFMIFIHPIVLGEGIPLFPPPLTTKTLTYQGCEAFDSGMVKVVYTR